MSEAQTLTFTLTLGSVHLQPSNNNSNSGDRRAAMAYVVPKLHRQRYGLGFEILASSNQSSPACLPSSATWQSKKAFPASNPEFAAVYKEMIRSTIVSDICALLPNRCWALNVFRTGYESEKLQNPIVIHLVVNGIGLDTSSGSTSNITEAQASQIVTTIIAAVVNSGWKGEEIRVDVCRSPQLSLQASNAFNKDGVDVLESIIDLYTFEAPLPGFSLGPRALPFAGTITGYIKHVSGEESQIFALTCHHVVSDTNLGPSSYLHKDGQTKHFITSPAFKDHLAATKAILDKIEDNQKDIISCIDKLASNLLLSTKARAVLKDKKEYSLAAEKLWERVKLEAANYDIDFGYVYATSGIDKSGSSSDWKGFLDWALISGPAHKQTQNRHVPWNVRDRGSGFPWNRPVKGLDKKSIEQAREHFDDGPNFKSLQGQALAEGQLVFKPTSRTTGWVVGEFNDIESVVNLNGTGPTTEWSIIASNAENNFFALGDSGAVILDQDFHPIAMLWGILDYGHGRGSMAYITPIVKILRDIEGRLGWEIGSATFY